MSEIINRSMIPYKYIHAEEIFELRTQTVKSTGLMLDLFSEHGMHCFIDLITDKSYEQFYLDVYSYSFINANDR